MARRASGVRFVLNEGTHVLWHNPMQTAADGAHNEAFVRGLVNYA